MDNVDTGWKSLTLVNSWVNYNASTHNIAEYRVDKNGMVHVRGLIKSGTLGAACAVLPKYLAPPEKLIYMTMSNNTVGRLDIANDGSIIPNAGSNAWFSINVSWYP